MDVLLISARSADRAPHWSRPVAGAAAAALIAAGARVRWLCAIGSTEPPPDAIAGVETTIVTGTAPAFRCVQQRVVDHGADVALARLLRPRPADVVAHLGFGAPGSVTSLWLADRMGARVVAAVRAPEVLCHRGTLVDERETACRSFLDPSRCAACCSAPTPAGLSAAQAAWARLLRPLRGLSPFPTAGHFQNRADLALASLQLAAAVLVAEPAERELLLAAGVLARSVCVAGTAAGVLDGIGVATAVAALRN